MNRTPGNTLAIAGQTFNRLTALEPTGERTSNRAAIWRFRCSCGEEVKIPAYKVKCGDRKSCGCHVLELMRERNQARLARREQEEQHVQ